MKIAPKAAPTDGVLDIQIEHARKREALAIMPKVYKGEHVPHPDIFEAKRVRASITSEPRLLIEADGEVLVRAIRYAVERKTLEMHTAHKALHDHLTGLANRDLFHDRLSLLVTLLNLSQSVRIHRLLETDPKTGGFKRNEEHPLDGHLLVVDETCDTGSTLKLALSEVRAIGPAAWLIVDTVPECYQALGVMEQHLRNYPFFVDNRYTIADIALYAYAHVAHESDFDLTPFPAVRSWLKRVAEQSGYVAMDQRNNSMVVAG